MKTQGHWLGGGPPRTGGEGLLSPLGRRISQAENPPVVWGGAAPIVLARQRLLPRGTLPTVLARQWEFLIRLGWHLCGHIFLWGEGAG